MDTLNITCPRVGRRQYQKLCGTGLDPLINGGDEPQIQGEAAQPVPLV
jgi:hypothetical protein